MPNLKTIVESYRRDYGHLADRERTDFANAGSLARAIELAATAQVHGKKSRHQWRIPTKVLNRGRNALMNGIKRIERSKSFDDLHSTVDELTVNIKGLGDLYVYDTACRIGAKLGLKPSVVYLHAGVRRGARNLGLVSKRGRIDIKELPAEFHSLDADEIEDILCTYRDQLAGAAMYQRHDSSCYRGVKKVRSGCRVKIVKKSDCHQFLHQR